MARHLLGAMQSLAKRGDQHVHVIDWSNMTCIFLAAIASPNKANGRPLGGRCPVVSSHSHSVSGAGPGDFRGLAARSLARQPQRDRLLRPLPRGG